MTERITRDEWLSEFERVMHAQPKGDPGMSTEELSQVLGVGQHRVNKLLRIAFLEGRVKAGRKPSVALDGRKCMVPCYQLLPVPKTRAQRSESRNRPHMKAAKTR